MKTAPKPHSFLSLLPLVSPLLEAPLPAEETAANVKSYLLDKLEKMNAASADFLKNSEAYSALVAEHGGSVDAAYRADPKQIDKLISKLRDGYKAMDSFGYETVEGIVAGVPSISEYDWYLDGGVLEPAGHENVAHVVLDLGHGTKIDKQGVFHVYHRANALNGDKRWIVPVEGGKKRFRARRVLTAAVDVNKKLGEQRSPTRGHGTLR
jgi:hypothetical protein